MSLKHILVAVFLLLFLLSGCSAEPAATEATPAPTESPTTAATEVATEAPTVPPTEPETVPPTEPETEVATEPPVELPYLQRIPDADQSILDGPGYEYNYVGTVKEAGTYTIVEEARDVDDNLWGRLKSGAGWVNLTDIRAEIALAELLTAEYTDGPTANCHFYAAQTEEYVDQVLFRAHQELTDFSLWIMGFQDMDFVPIEEVYRLDMLEPGTPLYAKLHFPGDMSSYGIRFTAPDGTEHFCVLSISGKDGSLILAEYDY